MIRREALKKGESIRTGNYYALFRAKRCLFTTPQVLQRFGNAPAFIVAMLNCHAIRDALLNDEADVGFLSCRNDDALESRELGEQSLDAGGFTANCRYRRFRAGKT